MIFTLQQNIGGASKRQLEAVQTFHRIIPWRIFFTKYYFMENFFTKCFNFAFEQASTAAMAFVQILESQNHIFYWASQTMGGPVNFFLHDGQTRVMETYLSIFQYITIDFSEMLDILNFTLHVIVMSCFNTSFLHFSKNSLTNPLRCKHKIAITCFEKFTCMAKGFIWDQSG